MAQLRDKIFKKINGIATKLPLNTDQSSGYETGEIESGIFDNEKIRVIHQGGLATSQDLLHVVEDLIENDRRINNEKNMGHSLLCNGIFPEEGANFDIELITSPIQKSVFYGFTVLHGKIKTEETIYEITDDCTKKLLSMLPDNPTEEETETYIIPDMTDSPTGYYRRDYLSVVYFDNSVGAPSNPVWRYISGDLVYSEPPVKHTQKQYADDEVGELWPAGLNKVDVLGQPAKFKEYIIYSFLYQYDGKGTWELLTDESGKNFPLSPDPNDYFELLEEHNENVIYEAGLYKYITGSGWTYVDDSNQHLGDAYPTSPTDQYILKCTGIGILAKGWYLYTSANKYTKLKKADLIPNYSGIASLINFKESRLIPYEENNVDMFRVAYSDKQFYHPYLEYTPLETEYGQGYSTAKEGVTCESDKYITNSLGYDYQNLNTNDVSLFNFPFMITSVDDSFNVSETVELDHIMLGYKKEGWWNGDYVRDYTTDKYYKIVDGVWTEVTPLAVNSAFPKYPETDDVFEDETTHKLYVYSGVAWVENTNIRHGKNLPKYPTHDDYFEIRDSAVVGIVDGLYVYDATYNGDTGAWGAKIWNEIAQEVQFVAIPEGVHNQEFAEYPEDMYNGRVFYANGNGSVAKGWYIFNVTAFFPITHGYGDKFPGGNDQTSPARWNETPQVNEYFKSTGEGDCDKGWWTRQATYWEKVHNDSMGNHAIVNSDMNTLDEDSIFISTGEDVSDGKPPKGAYEYKIGTWYRIPHDSGTDFPIYGLYNDLHFYLTSPMVGYIAGLYKYVEGKYVDKSSRLHYNSPAQGELESELPALNTLNATHDGMYFNINAGELTGWYQYQHSATPSLCRWNNISAHYLTYVPDYAMADETYVDINGLLYQYDSDTAYWEFIPDSLNAILDSPPTGYAGQYVRLSGVYEHSIPSYPAGFYRFSDSTWEFNTLTEVGELPALEDDIRVSVDQLKMFTGNGGEIDVEVTSATLISRVNGQWDIKISPTLNNRTKIGEATRNVAANDVIIITNGIGKYQIGYISAITDLGGSNETITIKGIYSDIEDQITGRSKAVFCSYNDFTNKGTALLTKVDVMAQIDEIDSYSNGIDLSVNETDAAKKISNINPLYQIKVTLDSGVIINKNNWCIIRTRSDKAIGSTPSWQTPKILIADQSVYTQPQRNGYISVRYVTVKGKYPYYGLDEDGIEDKVNLKYLVLEDTFDGSNWMEVQTESSARQKNLGFTKFKVVAKNLDDENALIVFDELSAKTTKDEIYLDVMTGRIMLHPDIYVKYRSEDGTSLRASFIVLNVLKGSITADDIIFKEISTNKQTSLYDKLIEIEKATKSTGDGRKLFNYRGKYAQVYQIDDTIPSKGVVLTQEVENGTDTIDSSVFLCYEDGTPIGPDKVNLFVNLYPKEPISLFCKGDEFTTALFNYNEGCYKVNDYFKLINTEDSSYKFYKYTSGVDTWVEKTFTSGTSFPLTPTNGQHFEIINTINDDGLYIYTVDTWVKVTDYSFPQYGYVLPSNAYLPLDNSTNKAKFVLAEETEDTSDTVRVMNKHALAFSITDDFMKSIDSVRYIGIQIESVGTGWSNLCAYVQAGDGEVCNHISIPRATIEGIVNNKELNNKDKWIYIPFGDAFPVEQEYYYHVHLYIDALNGGTAPTILGYYDDPAPVEEYRRKVFFKLLGRGADKTDYQPAYPDSDIFSLLFAENGYIVPESKLSGLPGVRNMLDVIDPTTNKPLCESSDYNFVIPVDFSNLTIWNKWNFANCIGYDAITGKIKFPSQLDPSLYSVEFNANWGDKNINSKSLALFSNPNASLEDVFNVFQLYHDTASIMEYVDKRIARYSPRGKAYTATGLLNETFLLDYVPTGYKLDENGDPIYDGNEYLGSDAAKKSLIITKNGVFVPPSDYTLDGKLVSFNAQLTTGDKIYIRGSEYKVLTTVANESVTPDSFSQETQDLFDELKNIRDVDFPTQITNAKETLLNYVKSVMEDAVDAQINIFKITSGRVTRWNEITSTWRDLGSAGSINYLTLTWDPYALKSLQITKNNVPVSIFDYSLENENEVHFTFAMVESDTYEIRGNLIREAVTSESMVTPKEDVFNVVGSQSLFACSFYASSKDAINVFVEGVYNSRNNYTLLFDKASAIVDGEVDLTGGHDWATQNQSFQISVNEEALTTVILNENCGNITAVLAHINARLEAVNLELDVIAEARNTNFVRLRTTGTGKDKSITLVASPTNDALITLGLAVGKYLGQNNTISVQFDTPVGDGQTVVIKTVDVTDAGIMGITANLQEQINEINDKLDVINFDAPALLDSFKEVQDAMTDFESAVITENALLKARLETTEIKNLDQELRLEYLEGRQQQGSDRLLDLFFDNKYTDLSETDYDKKVKLMKDLDFNNAWKNREGKIDFTQGLIKNDDQAFMLEVIDEYNLDNVGQTLKNQIKYDSTNNCYWMLSCASGDNGVGEITKLSIEMRDGRVEVLGRWLLPVPGLAGRTWRGGICVNSTGTMLYFAYAGIVVNTNLVYAIAINSNNTLGEANFQKRSGETIDLTYSVKYTLSTSHELYTTAAYIINDIIDWSDTEIAYLWCNASSVGTLKFLTKTGLTTGSTTAITMFGNFIGSTNTTHYRSMCLHGRNLYIRIDDALPKKYIYKFNLDTDMDANRNMYRASGRFENARQYSDISGVGDSSGGICVGVHGDLLEITSTASNGKTISRRSLKNALWSENQVIGERVLNSLNNIPTTPVAMMVDSNGAYWTADMTVTAGTVKIYRYDPDGSKHALTTVHATWTGIRDMTTDGTSVWIIAYTTTGTLYQVFKIAFETLNTAMNAVAEDGSATFVITSNGGIMVSATPSFATNTDALHSICYNSDDAILYLVNDTNDKIDTLTLVDSPVWTKGAYDLPAPTSVWGGIAYKNGNIYIRDCTVTTNPNRIFVIPKNKMNSSYMYRSHIYQDPSLSFVAAGAFCIDFIGNDLVSMHQSKYMNKIKVLEDPDVLQLHTYIDAFNVLISAVAPASLTLAASGVVSFATSIVQRKFKPEEYTEALKISRITPSMLLYHGGYVIGTVNLSAGFDWSSTNQAIAVNDGTTNKTITMTQNKTNISDVVTYLNSLLAAATASKAEAFVYNDIYVGIRNTVDANLTLTNSTGTPMATLGWGTSGTTYNASDAYYIVRRESQRNVPDNNYCGVAYGDEGFSLLMLDKYLSDRSITGKHRYDVRNITAKHYKRGTNNIINSATAVGSCMWIQDDMIVYGGTTGAIGVWIDLKDGKAVSLAASTTNGQYYNGYLSERNDGKGWTGSLNAELATSNIIWRKVHGITFTKNDISQYSGENPRTFFSIGTDGGNDLLEVVWDNNNERTPVRLLNLIAGTASYGQYASWIAPSGIIFFGNYAATGNIYQSVKPIWEIETDSKLTIALGTLREIGSGLLGAIYVTDISPNSRCWKTASGAWRHQLIVGTLAVAAGTSKMAIVDIENSLVENIYVSASVANQGFYVMDNFEDKIFAPYNTTTLANHLIIMKKYRYNDKLDTLMFNGWTYAGYALRGASRPRITAHNTGATATAPVCRYSAKHGILATGTSITGLLFHHFHRMNSCKHVSTQLEVSPEVKEVYYKENVVEG